MIDDRPLRHAEDWSSDEARALAAWTAEEPPADLVAQVLSRRGERRERDPRLARWAGLAAAVLLVLGIALYWRARLPVAGELTTTRRTTIALGARAVAVAEAGARLGWRVAGSGRARVEQSSGEVFYRVEHGGPFVVITPRGSVEVLGTCFRVEVSEMRASRVGMLGAAGGAALATIVVVTVYEGRVLTASPRGSLALSAGEAGRLTEQEAPQKVLGDLTARAAAGPGGPGEALSAGELRVRNEQLSAEVARLREQVSALQPRSSPNAEAGRDGHRKFFDFSKDELVAMAKNCEVRWDMPALGTEPAKIGEKDRGEIGLTADEAATVERLIAEQHRQLTQKLRQLYIEATGDAKGAEALSPSSLLSEIDDKSSTEERRAMFQRLSRQRAGLETAPADLRGTPVVERAYRLLTQMGDQLEHAIGAEIGPDLARRFREGDGFGSRYVHSGCPQQ